MEEWRIIRGYDGKYLISNLGRVMCIGDRWGRPQNLIMSNARHTNGYEFIYLSLNGKKHYNSIHRLVATHFIPNPNNLPEVNHIDMVRDNNKVDNLEWCTHKYNNNSCRKKIYSKTVIGISLDGTSIVQFDSASEAGRCLKISASHITAVCKKHYGFKSCGNYRWYYKEVQYV